MAEIRSTSENSRRPAAFGQVHAPTLGESLRMTVTDVRNRLGRSVVTLGGIVLGIAFLMSTLVSSDIRASLAEVSLRHLKVQNMVAVVRAEIGKLESKRVVILVPQVVRDELLLDGFATELRAGGLGEGLVGPVPMDQLGGQPRHVDDASALVVWMADPPAVLSADWKSLLARMRQPVVLVYGDGLLFDSPGLAEIRVRKLLPPLDQQAAHQAEIDVRQRRGWWLVGVSLVVATMGIANALLMNVTERYREIGTMKCLGALNSFIMRLILLESSFLGILGAILGIVLGVLFAVGAYSGTYGRQVVLEAMDGGSVAWAAGACMVLGWMVAVLAAIYPARVAAHMVPADALRTEV